jgi:hypothetical protein
MACGVKQYLRVSTNPSTQTNSRDSFVNMKLSGGNVSGFTIPVCLVYDDNAYHANHLKKHMVSELLPPEAFSGRASVVIGLSAGFPCMRAEREISVAGINKRYKHSLQ